MNSLPLSMEELQIGGLQKSLDDLLFEGCYPAVQSEHLDPTKAYANYVATYLERDIRKMMHVHNIGLSRADYLLGKLAREGESTTEPSSGAQCRRIIESEPR